MRTLLIAVLLAGICTADCRTKLGVFTATAYTLDYQSCGRWAKYARTSTGRRPRVGYVAVDPRVIPYHSKLFIEGIGIRWAEDTGGAIMGNRVDIFMNTRREAIKFGRRKVKVWVLSRGGSHV